MTSPPSFFISRIRRRSGVSPVIATTIILAITITLGLGLWSFAASGVGTATDNYARVVTEYGEFTADRFVIANVDFNNPSSNRIAFWLFNSGKLETDFCRYDPSNPTKCQDEPSISVVCIKDCSSLVPAPADLCQHDPSGSCLTRTMPDGNIVRDFRVASKELGKFSFDITSIESGGTYEITVYSDTGASQMFLKKSS